MQRGLWVSVAVGLLACGGAQQPSAGRGDNAFNRGAAVGALGSVDLKVCSSATGPSGAGHIVVTFVPDGSVSDTRLDKGPIGTPRGDCVLKQFRTAHVPSFDGTPVTVGKAFTLE